MKAEEHTAEHLSGGGLKERAGQGWVGFCPGNSDWVTPKGQHPCLLSARGGTRLCPGLRVRGRGQLHLPLLGEESGEAMAGKGRKPAGCRWWVCG